jgi:hypothetical protein
MSAEVNSLSNSFTVDDVTFTFNQRASSDGFLQMLKSRFVAADNVRMKLQIERLKTSIQNSSDEVESKEMLAKVELLERTITNSSDTNILNLDYIWLWAGNNLMGVSTFIEFCIAEFESLPDAVMKQKKAKELAMKIPPRLWPRLIDKANKSGGYGFLDESSGRVSGL